LFGKPVCPPYTLTPLLTTESLDARLRGHDGASVLGLVNLAKFNRQL
jgi:hypothetical protein